jgi:SAM-dependent methyltransferase
MRLGYSKAVLPHLNEKKSKEQMGMLTDFAPVIGDAKALAEIPELLGQGRYGAAGVNALSVLPFVGALGDASRVSRKAADEAIEANRASQTTQRANTVGTATKVSDYLDSVGASGKSLDYGAGMGLNAQAAKIDDTFEPFPQGAFSPTFTAPSKIPSNTYGKIISTNVINVLPPSLRAEAILNIGRALTKDGKALIQTWDTNAAKAGMKSKKATPVKTEENAFTTSTGSYQKGFTNKELKQYTENVLGDGYTVDIVPNKAKISGSAVVITKK